jgi:hypothetical protein
MLQQWYNIRYIQDWVAQSPIEANLLLNIYHLWTFYEVIRDEDNRRYRIYNMPVPLIRQLID